MEPNMGLELTTLRSRPELRSRVGHLTNWATQAPHCSLFENVCICPGIFGNPLHRPHRVCDKDVSDRMGLKRWGTAFHRRLWRLDRVGSQGKLIQWFWAWDDRIRSGLVLSLAVFHVKKYINQFIPNTVIQFLYVSINSTYRFYSLFFFSIWNLLSNWFPYNTQCSPQQVPSSVPSAVRDTVTGWPSMNFQGETCMDSDPVLALSSCEKVPLQVFNSESMFN